MTASSRNSYDEFVTRYHELQALFDNALDAVIGMDSTGCICEWNRHAEIMFGWKKEKVLHRSMAEVILPETGRGGFIFNRRVEMTALRSSGEEFPVELVVTPVVVNSLSFFFAFIRDITERKKIEERTAEIKKAYAFVDALLENIPDMIFVKEVQNLRFVRFNKAGENLIGYSRNEMIGKNDYDFFPTSEADFFTSKDRAVLQSKTLVDIPEEPIHTVKGTRLLHTKKIPIMDEHGDPEYLLGISEDITERRQAEEDRHRLRQERLARAEAEKALALRDEFISIAAHELKTPLTALNMQLQMLGTVMPELMGGQTPRQKIFVELMKDSQENLARFSGLVDDLLDVSRMAAGRLIIEPVEVHLSEIVNRVIGRYTVALRKAQCEIKPRMAPLPKVHWDPVRIEQVLVNLLTNAMKYGVGKPIEIESKLEGETVVLSVKDYGIGIAREDQERIFERFERAVSAKAFGGLGLGLYISKQILKAHGGTIRVESEPGFGAKFIIELPLRSEWNGI